MLEPFVLGAVSAPVIYGIVYCAADYILKRTEPSLDADEDVPAGE